MKVLFTRFPLESRFGGAEKQTLSLMSGLMKHGHEVSFLGSCPTLLKEVPHLTSHVSRLDIGKPPVTKWGAMSFLWRQFWMKKKLISQISNLISQQQSKSTNNEQRTTIMMLSLSEKLLLTKWAHDQNIKVIWIEHDTVGRWLTMNPWRHRLKRLHKLCTTITVSELSREIYIRLGWKPDNIIAIPNGIDIEKYHPIAEQRKEPKFPTIRIGCIARLTKDKGVHILIEAMKGISDASLIILGNGPEERSLKRLTKKLHLTKVVDCVYEVKSISSFYADIDLLVLPSIQNDPFGLVVAEAMASGIPTICTEACGIARHVSDEETMIVPAGDATSLRKGIELMQSSLRWVHYAKRGRIAASSEFSVLKMISRYEQMMQ
jgi:glycosyltransferase involved in cell wall biosynthesis